MNNSIPCGGCKHFGREKTGSSTGPRDARFGWCKAQSVYPTTGMAVPEGAPTTTAAISKPYIVAEESLVRECVKAVRA